MIMDWNALNYSDGKKGTSCFFKEQSTGKRAGGSGVVSLHLSLYAAWHSTQVTESSASAS
jgi:hypothetical protein